MDDSVKDKETKDTSEPAAKKPATRKSKKTTVGTDTKKRKAKSQDTKKADDEKIALPETQGLNESIDDNGADLALPDGEPVQEDLDIDVSLDSLLIDSDDGVVTDTESEDRLSGFDEFLADYKATMKQALSTARVAFGMNTDEDKASGEDTESSDEENGGDFAVTEELFDDGIAQLSMDIGEGAIVSDSEDEEEERPYSPDKPRIIDQVFDFAELFIFTLSAVLILTTFFFKHTIVDGGSMMNTLEHQDHLIISDFLYTPERGDIIVFQDPAVTGNDPWVKRVIGLPGETVEIRINTIGEYEVYINGNYLDEEYDYNSLERAPIVGKWTVGEDEVFVLGDNRYNSTDSRVVGPIKSQSILGKVLFRIYPFDKIGTVD